jgi:hypothetical protein
MMHESTEKQVFNLMHPYAIIVLGWITLGIGTSLAAPFPLWRIVFISSSWFLFESGWDYFQYYLRTSYSDEDDPVWYKVKVRITEYARPLFHVWLGVLAHNILWWETGNVNLEDNNVLFGCLQSGVIVFCVLVSFWLRVAEHAHRRNYLKWLMLAVAFLLPPWKTPWYEENIILQQSRWIIMVILFVIQCFESYASTASEKRYIADLYLLRIGWVALVQPIFLVFTLACFLYYGVTMIQINIVIPGYADPEKQASQKPMMVYGSPHPQTSPAGTPILQHINQGYGLAHLMVPTNAPQQELEPELIPDWYRSSGPFRYN